MSEAKSGVYFVQAGWNGPIKIGFSDDVDKRIAGLQTGNPEELRLLLVVPGTMGTEAAMHEQFAAARIRPTSEWFNATKELLSFVGQTIEDDEAYRSRYTQAKFRLRECMIAWTPTGAKFMAPCDLPMGSIRVGPHPDAQGHCGWSYNYLNTTGACWGSVAKLESEAAKHWLYNLFAHIVARDGIAPTDAHREFLKIEEYRDGLSDDMPGIGTPLP